jgi:hypothetical protein
MPFRAGLRMHHAFCLHGSLSARQRRRCTNRQWTANKTLFELQSRIELVACMVRVVRKARVVVVVLGAGPRTRSKVPVRPGYTRWLTAHGLKTQIRINGRIGG